MKPSKSITIPTLNLKKLSEQSLEEKESEWFEDTSEVLGNMVPQPSMGSLNHEERSSFIEEGGLHFRGENFAQLQRALELREFELIKSIEYGQSLLTRIKFLDGQLENERAEKERLEKNLDMIEEESVVMKHRLESLELTIEVAKKEMNILLTQRELSNKQIEELSVLPEENKALSKKIVELGDRVKECILIIEEQKDEIKHLKEHNVSTSENEKSEDKKKKMQEAEYKRALLELQQKVEKLQSERDASHIQARVKINELNQIVETLTEKEKMLKRHLQRISSSNSLSILNKLRQVKTDCEHLKDHFSNQILSINEDFENLKILMNGASFHESQEILMSGRVLRNSTSNDLSYANLQKKIIEELGLDNFFSSYGCSSTPKKSGWLRVYQSIWDHTNRWVKISSSGLSLFEDNTEKKLLNCFSLCYAILKISSKNELIFEISCGYGKGREKVLQFTTSSAQERNEWCSFISTVLELVT